MVLNSLGRVSIVTSDPDVVLDLTVTKNQQIDKTGQFKRVLSCLFGEGFIFSLTDDLWKQKRRATAHAFYKDRLSVMLEALKEQVKEQMAVWDT